MSCVEVRLKLEGTVSVIAGVIVGAYEEGYSVRIAVGMGLGLGAGASDGLLLLGATVGLEVVGVRVVGLLVDAIDGSEVGLGVGLALGIVVGSYVGMNRVGMNEMDGS